MKKKKILSMVLSLLLVAATFLSFNILSPNKAEAANTATVVFHDFATTTGVPSTKVTDTVTLDLSSSSISLWGKTVSPGYQIMADEECYSDIEFIGWTTSETVTDLPSTNTLNQTVTAASPLHLYSVYQYTIHCDFYSDSSYSNLLKRVTSEPIRVNASVANVEDASTVIFPVVDFVCDPLPYRLGYNVASWKRGIMSYPTASPIITDSNFYVYANWAECDTYTLKYDANGGSGAPDSQEENVGLPITVSSTTPARTGYTFAGWNTNADGTGGDYAVGSSYTSSAKGAYTLYAQWSANDSILSTIIRAVATVCKVIINVIKSIFSIVM